MTMPESKQAADYKCWIIEAKEASMRSPKRKEG
jgi:hypothetical protein